jgi:hypothetical protein
MKHCAVIALSFLSGLFLAVGLTHAHGVIGKRFFPATLVVDDPFVSDELDLLKVNKGSKNEDGTETSVGFEFSKRLTPDFDLSVGWDYLFFDPREAGKSSTSGQATPNSASICVEASYMKLSLPPVLWRKCVGLGRREWLKESVPLLPVFYLAKDWATCRTRSNT